MSPGAQCEPSNNKFIYHKFTVLVLENARVIDGTGDAPQEAQTTIIEDGKTIIPGYVTHREHLYYHSMSQVTGMPYLAIPSMVTVPRLYLSAGVTTARSIGTYHPFDDLKLKEGIEKDILLGRDLFLTALFIQGDPKYYQLMPEIAYAEAAKREVRYWSERGFHNFKTYVDISRSQLTAAAGEANLHGKNINAHLCSMSILEAIEPAIDEIGHGFQFTAVDILRLRKGRGGV